MPGMVENLTELERIGAATAERHAEKRKKHNGQLPMSGAVVNNDDYADDVDPAKRRSK